MQIFGGTLPHWQKCTMSWKGFCMSELGAIYKIHTQVGWGRSHDESV